MKKSKQTKKNLIQRFFATKWTLILIIAISFLSACKKTEELSVTTTTPSNITETTATLGGEVTSDGGNAVTERGICLSEEVNPTIDDVVNDVTFTMGAGLGVFTDDYSGFIPNSTIHVRAYATNSTGTVYGEDKVFTTTASAACTTVNIPANASISTVTNWTAGNVYVLDGTVTVTSTLNIEAGVVVKFKAGARMNIQSSGKVIALGTSGNRIVFTSIKDDNYCGDTNGDGNATVPAAGDWTCIYLNGASTATSINSFTYCDFFYGGANDNPYNNVIRVAVNGSAFTFDNCVFAHTKSVLSNSASYAFYAGNYMRDNTLSVFTNNTFYDNDRPIYLDVKYSMATNNVFYNPLNPSVKNTRNGIWMYNGGMTSSTTVNWNVTGVPYILDGYFQIKSLNSVLNIGSNVIVKFLNPSDGILTDNTSLNFDGTTIFTSIKDDVNGGDTNGDGNATSPANGDWYGLENRPLATSTFYHGSNILYAAN